LGFAERPLGDGTGGETPPEPAAEDGRDTVPLAQGFQARAIFAKPHPRLHRLRW